MLQHHEGRRALPDPGNWNRHARKPGGIEHVGNVLVGELLGQPYATRAQILQDARRLRVPHVERRGGLPRNRRLTHGVDLADITAEQGIRIPARHRRARLGHERHVPRPTNLSQIDDAVYGTRFARGSESQLSRTKIVHWLATRPREFTLAAGLTLRR